MTAFHFFVLATLCLITVSSLILAMKLKKELDTMGSMIFSMAFGMCIGLTIGVLLGSLFKGELYFSTVISILAATIAGVATGSVFGIVPALEAFMSGLMGAMMGAMLGEMITPVQANVFINIFLTFSVSTLLLIIIISTSSDKSVNLNRPWILKPILIFVILAGYLGIGGSLGNRANGSETPIENTHANHNEETTTNISVTVSPSQFSYAPREITLKRNQKIKLTLKNNDSIEHDIEIEAMPLLQQNEEGQTAAIQTNFHIHATANSQAEGEFTPTQEGTYQYFCTIPGHKEQGMVGIIEVI